MELSDWVLVIATFAACFAGSAFGAYLTNRHASRTESAQWERERIQALNRILISYGKFVNKKMLDGIRLHVRDAVADGAGEHQRIEPSEELVAYSDGILSLSQQSAQYLVVDDAGDRGGLAESFSRFESDATSFGLMANFPQVYRNPSDRASSSGADLGEALSELESKLLKEYLDLAVAMRSRASR